MHIVFFWTLVLEKTLERPLDCKEIQPVHPKGDQPWVFIGRTDVKAETPIFWPPDAKSLTHWKRPWCWERLRAGEGDDRGWDGWMASPTQWTWVWVDSRSWWWKEGLACCGSWGHKESDMNEQLNWLTLFSGHNAIVHLIDDSTVYFMYTEKPKQLCESIYCHIYFISVAWSQTHDTSKVCL